GLITRRQAKRLFMMLSAKGWRKAEPVQISAEKPRRLRKMIETAFGPAPNIDEVAGLVHAAPRLVRQIVECHAGRDELSLRPARLPSQQRNQQASKIIDFQTR